jgi:hypothetical protein
MKKLLKDLLIKREYWFTETFARDMTMGVDGRLKLTDLEGNKLDVADWANKICLDKCGMEPPENVEDATCNDCFHRCDVPMLYLAIVKLGMIETMLSKLEITGEFETKIKE